MHFQQTCVSLCLVLFIASLFPLLSPFFIQICFLRRQTVGEQPFARLSKGVSRALERRLDGEREKGGERKKRKGGVERRGASMHERKETERKTAQGREDSREKLVEG